MALKHGLLGLLSYSAMTGYELGKAFQDSLSFFWQAQPSQIYRELHQLETLGHLRSEIEVQTDKPNKRIYSITESGKAELAAWLVSPMPDEIMATRSEVLMRLFFSAYKKPEDVTADLKHMQATYQTYAAQLGQLNGIIENYKALVQSDRDALYWELTADFGCAYAEMCAAWAQRCVKRLEEAESDEHSGAERQPERRK